MADIKKLLNKKGWTGRELGIIELTNMCHIFKQGLEGKMPPTPLVERGQFQKMLNSIQDSQQGKTYNGYIAIHDWISKHYSQKLAYEQQAQLHFKSLSEYITQASVAEDLFLYIEQLPVIMTQKQYEEERARGLDIWMHGEDGQTHRTEALIYVVYTRAFEYFANLLDKDPRKPNPLKPIRKKYLSEPIGSPLIRARYNHAAERGYWQIDDGSGRRDDQMTEEEWQEAITTPKVKKLLEQNGRKLPPGREPDTMMLDTIESIAHERHLHQAQVIYEGGSVMDALDAQKKKDLADGLGVQTSWHEYEDFPEDLTKWDVLVDALATWQIYGELFEMEEPDPAEYMAELKDFVAEFPEMVEAMLKEISATWYGGTEDLTALPLERWRETRFAWDEMYDRDLYGFREEWERDDVIWDGNWRAISKGIAILQPGDHWGTKLDERGYYIPPTITRSIGKWSLESFFTESEYYADNVAKVERHRETILDSYYYLMASNIVIDMIMEYYDVPALEIFKYDLENIGGKIDALNEMVVTLHWLINQTHYEDQQLKEKKLQVLRDIFPPIKYKHFKVPEETIEKVRSLFPGFEAFKDYDIAELMLWRPAESGEDGDLDE